MMGLASPSHKWDTWRRNHWNIVHNSRRLRKREKKSVGWRKVHARSPFERSASARYPRRFRRARRDDKVGRRLQSPNRRRPLKLNCLHKENWGKQDISKQNRTLWINNSTHTHTLTGSNVCGMRSWWPSKNRNQSLSGIPKSVLRTCEETLWFFCNSLARFLLLQLLFSCCCNEGRVTSGLSLWFKVARAKRRWIFSLLLESARIISIRHNRHVSSERHSRAWLRCVSLTNSFSRILYVNSFVYQCKWRQSNNQTTLSQYSTFLTFSPQNLLFV